MKKVLITIGLIIFLPSILSEFVLTSMKAAEIYQNYEGTSMIVPFSILAVIVFILAKVVLPLYKKKMDRKKKETQKLDYYEHWKSKRLLEMDRVKVWATINDFLEKKYGKALWSWAEGSTDHIIFADSKGTAVRGKVYFDDSKGMVTYVKCENHPNLMGEKIQKCVPKAYLVTFFNDFVMDNNDTFSRIANEAILKGAAAYDASGLKNKRERKILADVLVKESGFTTATVEGKNIILTLSTQGGN